MATTIFKRLIFLIKIRTFPLTLYGCQRTLYKEGFEIMSALPILVVFFFFALSLLAGERPAQHVRDLQSRQTDISAPISPKIYNAAVSETPGMVTR